jgi:hypothetical protein
MLQKINEGWSMFYRVSKAASGATAQGKFTPTDLLRALRSSDPSQHGFARGTSMGDGTLQAYANLGDKALKGAHLGPLDLVHALTSINHPLAALSRISAKPIGRTLPKAAAPAGATAAQAFGPRLTDPPP